MSELEATQRKLCLRDREMAKVSAEMSALDDKVNILTAQKRFYIVVVHTYFAPVFQYLGPWSWAFILSV